MDEIKINVSPTLLNDYASYKKGETCGEFIRLVRIDRVVPQEKLQSKAMLYGQRFEYEALGNLNVDGSIPEAFFSQRNGSPLKIQAIITRQAINFKEWKEQNNVEILEKGLKLENKFDNLDINIKGILDAVIMINGEKALLDTKLSGNLFNSESPYGWHMDTLLSHEYKIRQIIIYMYLYNTLYNDNVSKFIFFVASSKEDDRFFPFVIDVSKETYEKRLNDNIELAKEMLFEFELGLTAFPEPDRCNRCPAKDYCLKKVTNFNNDPLIF